MGHRVWDPYQYPYYGSVGLCHWGWVSGVELTVNLSIFFSTSLLPVLTFPIRRFPSLCSAFLPFFSLSHSDCTPSYILPFASPSHSHCSPSFLLHFLFSTFSLSMPFSKFPSLSSPSLSLISFPPRKEKSNHRERRSDHLVSVRDIWGSLTCLLESSAGLLACCRRAWVVCWRAQSVCWFVSGVLSWYVGWYVGVLMPQAGWLACWWRAIDANLLDAGSVSLVDIF